MTLPPAAAHTIHNERIKLTANALDRASTACFAGGVIAPWAMWRAMVEALPTPTVPIALAIILALWTAGGLALHHLADKALGGLR